MFVAHHLILSAYGFWLPNDPRGTGSNFVGSNALYDFAGRATKVDDGRSRASDPHDRGRRVAAREFLKWPPVLFTGVQARAVGRGIAEYVERMAIPIWACAIMPDHAHFVIAECGKDLDQTIPYSSSKRPPLGGCSPRAFILSRGRRRCGSASLEAGGRCS